MSADGQIEKSAVLTEYYTAKQLKEDLKQRDQVWKQKFTVTHDLRESQAQHKEATEQSIREVHKRIDSIVRDLVPRAEVEKRMQTLVAEVQGCMNKVFNNSEALKELTARVQRHELQSAQTFATKLEVEALEKRQTQALYDIRSNMQGAVDAIRQESASKKEVEQSLHAAGERSAALEEATAALRRDLTQLDRSLESLQHRTEDHFAKKLGLKELEATLMLEIQRRDDSHAGRIDSLRGSHASKQHVDDRVAVCQSDSEALREDLSKLSKEVEEKAQQLAELTQLCKDTLAPRSELVMLSSTVKEDRLCSDKIGDDVKKLTEELDSDRERLTALYRSMQANRTDLNELGVQMQEFRDLREDYDRHKDFTRQFQEQIDHREKEHFREMKADCLKQTQIVDRLDQTVSQIKAECKVIADKQEKDTHMLKEQSTIQFFESMDKALGLSKDVTKIRNGGKQKLQTQEDNHIRVEMNLTTSPHEPDSNVT